MQISRPTASPVQQTSVKKLSEQKIDSPRFASQLSGVMRVNEEQLEAPIQSEWTHGEKSREESIVNLTPGEQQVINMMFSDGVESESRLYGPKQPRPVPIGNFIDLRG